MSKKINFVFPPDEEALSYRMPSLGPNEATHSIKLYPGGIKELKYNKGKEGRTH